MLKSPKVVILCNSNGNRTKTDREREHLEFANSVLEFLSTTLDICDASIRITDHSLLPSILESISNENNVVFATVGDGDDPSLKFSLECMSSSPFVVLNVTDVEISALRIGKIVGLVDEIVKKKVEEFMRKKNLSIILLDYELKHQSWFYRSKISTVYESKSQITGIKVKLDGVEKKSGKVRDQYDLGDKLALVTTDRQSGFDRMLALVPYKGQVLNLTSAFWFRKTEKIIGNHILSVPHPNVSIVKKCQPFPIEFVVRSYLTGSTSTSIWKNYENGCRNYCGHSLPENMTKNQKLWENILTPTTKEEDHDRPISSEDIVKEGWMSQSDLDVCAKAALECFALGQEVAAEHGLILVDTKYEMGKDKNGSIIVIDEMHTPDSSRYWLETSYKKRIKAGLEPENIDKEFLRLWFKQVCDPYKDENIPEAPKDLVCELARRYIKLFEMITWNEFEFDNLNEGSICDAIQKFM